MAERKQHRNTSNLWPMTHILFKWFSNGKVDLTGTTNGDVVVLDHLTAGFWYATLQVGHTQTISVVQLHFLDLKEKEIGKIIIMSFSSGLIRRKYAILSTTASHISKRVHSFQILPLNIVLHQLICHIIMKVILFCPNLWRKKIVTSHHSGLKGYGSKKVLLTVLSHTAFIFCPYLPYLLWKHNKVKLAM